MTGSRSATDHPDLPSHERVRLLAAVTGRPLGDVRAGITLTAAEQRRFEVLAFRRLGGEPLQYLEGTVVFGPVELLVDERVLIPRPETEHLLGLVRRAPVPAVIVDLCTGSGALALALKKIFPSARVIGTDVSAAALDVARANGVANRLAVDWYEGDLFDCLPEGIAGKVDLLVSNPPYIAESDWAGLPFDVRREPRLALVAGATGLEVAERVLAQVRHWITASGEAWIEVGEDQARSLAEQFGAGLVSDQYGRDRFVWIQPTGS